MIGNSNSAHHEERFSPSSNTSWRSVCPSEKRGRQIEAKGTQAKGTQDILTRREDIYKGKEGQISFARIAVQQFISLLSFGGRTVVGLWTLLRKSLTAAKARYPDEHLQSGLYSLRMRYIVPAYLIV